YHYIDTYVVKSGSTYHAFTKNETTKYIEHWTSTSLTSGWSSQGQLWTSGYEGPAVLRMSDGSWRIWVDKYTNGGIWTATSPDLDTWSGLNQITCPGCRHGTILPVTDLPGPAPVHRVTNRNSGKVIDVISASTANNAEIKQWTWNGGGNQKWQFQDAGGGYVRIVNQHSGKCLDVAGFGTGDGADRQQYAGTGGTNQQWPRPQVWPDGTPHDQNPVLTDGPRAHRRDRPRRHRAPGPGRHQPVPRYELGRAGRQLQHRPARPARPQPVRQQRDRTGESRRALRRHGLDPGRQHRPAAHQHPHRGRHHLVERLPRRHRRRHRPRIQGHPRVLGGRRRLRRPDHEPRRLEHHVVQRHPYLRLEPQRLLRADERAARLQLRGVARRRGRLARLPHLGRPRPGPHRRHRLQPGPAGRLQRQPLQRDPALLPPL